VYGVKEHRFPVVPYVNELGLRDYHAHVDASSSVRPGWPSRWPWLVLVVCVLGLVLRVWR